MNTKLIHLPLNPAGLNTAMRKLPKRKRKYIGFDVNVEKLFQKRKRGKMVKVVKGKMTATMYLKENTGNDGGTVFFLHYYDSSLILRVYKSSSVLRNAACIIK